jgi:hypothetical protein
LEVSGEGMKAESHAVQTWSLVVPSQ